MVPETGQTSANGVEYRLSVISPQKLHNLEFMRPVSQLINFFDSHIRIVYACSREAWSQSPRVDIHNLVPGIYRRIENEQINLSTSSSHNDGLSVAITEAPELKVKEFVKWLQTQL